MKTIFIDGSAGTTGLRIRERLAARADLRVVVLPDDVRKDPEARRTALNDADVAFLCLPDAAAVEAVAMVENPKTVVIDTSTAHRTADGWEYGFPELAGRRERLARATRIANPGCHASGFIALVEPLVRAGVLPRSAQLAAFSLTGYSGGGKKMIGAYEEIIELSNNRIIECGKNREAIELSNNRIIECEKNGQKIETSTDNSTIRQFDYSIIWGGRQYALGQAHKHLPEMAKVCGLEKAPVFSPIVVPHYSGMEVTVQVAADQFANLPAGGVIAALKKIYRDYYATGLVRFADDPAAAEGGFLSSAALSGRDAMEVSVYGNGERVLLVSRFDNLGKGASGAAIQNMNLVLGCDETAGLVP
jgi:N-acetyl-gamma-glutamyl-phosphate reductase